MLRASDSRRGKVDLARIGFGVRNEVGDRPGWNRRIDEQDEWQANAARNGRNIANEIELKSRKERGANRIRESAEDTFGC